jgi:hypothetical protein
MYIVRLINDHQNLPRSNYIFKNFINIGQFGEGKESVNK